MTVRLLERESERELLAALLEGAAAGEGAVVLVAGEAGIGKSSLLRAFAQEARGRARVLIGACDDLLTPRTLGPIRDAFAGDSPGLRKIMAEGSREELLSGVLAELEGRRQPTLLVVEDVHWADDATLDVLRYVGRRIDDLPAMIVISYRNDEVDRAHSAQRLIGGLAGGPVHRIALQPLSRAAVAALSGGTAATSAPLYQLTGGNPFYVAEVLAASERRDVPLTVVDAVLAQVHRLAPASQEALDQLAVVPSRVELRLARALLGDLTVLAEAERRGLLEVGPHAVAFRHELARRALENALPVSERMRLHARVLAELTHNEEIDLPRVLHHAIEAGDDATVIELAPQAAERAGRLGSYAQWITYHRLLLDRSDLLAAAEVATIRLNLASALFVVGDTVAALDEAQTAIAIRERIGDPELVGEALIFLGPSHWVLGQTAEALDGSSRAVAILHEAAPGSRSHCYALMYHAMLLGLIGRAEESLECAREAQGLAPRCEDPELLTMTDLAVGRAQLLIGEPDMGLALMQAALAATRELHAHTFVILTYILLVQDLYDLGRYAESQHYLDEGLAYAAERELDFYVEHLTAYQLRLRALHGEYDDAIAGLRRLVGSRADGEKGSLRYALSPLARLLAQTGADDAAEHLAWARDYSERAACYYDLLCTGFAEIEQAWLTGRPNDADPVVQRLKELTVGPGRAVERGELHRWKKRLGGVVEVPAGCPERLAAGIRGDWRVAVGAWREIDAPYQEALELMESGDVEATRQALAIFDQLGAKPAAALTRQRLRGLGVTQIPRGPQPTTRTNPAGLTERQMEILRLLVHGRTNAEIARELVVSVRTVDHHVSAVLQKLGTSSRRGAGAAASALGIDLNHSARSG